MNEPLAPRLATVGVGDQLTELLTRELEARMECQCQVAPAETLQGHFAAAIIGPAVEDIIDAAQHVHRLNRTAPTLIVCPAEQAARLRQELLYAAGVNRDTQVMNAESLPTQMDTIAGAVERGQRRLEHRLDLAHATEQLEATQREPHYLPVSLDRLIAGLPVGILLTGADERILLLNAAAAALTGLDPDRGVGAVWSCWIPQAQVADARRLYEMSGADDEVLDIELAAAHGARTLELRMHLHSEGRRLLSLTDVSDRVRAARAVAASERLLRDSNNLLEQKVADRVAELEAKTREIERLYGVEQAEQAKARFISTMSHEIRTPLHNIIGLIELSRDTRDPEEVLRYLDLMIGSARALQGVVDDILDFSRLESGMLKLDAGWFDISELLREVASAVAGSAAEKKLRLLWFCDPRIDRELHVDGHRLRQILTNLAGNAVKFTDQGSISIECRLAVREHEHDRVDIAVIDTGIGIDPALHASVFESFVQADGSSTRRAGSGLGLTICQHLATLMGTRVTLNSTPGQGSAFGLELRLPRRLDQPPQGGDRPLQGTCLALDIDDPRERGHLQHFLEHAGAIIDSTTQLKLREQDAQTLVLHAASGSKLRLPRPLDYAGLADRISSARSDNPAADGA